MNTTFFALSSPTTFSAPTSLSKSYVFSSNILVPTSPSKRGFQNAGIRCNCNFLPGGSPSGDSDSSSKSVLDAFYLGKALAEAVNERIESTVGELLSTVGRLQAEQQRQVQDFQEDVLERAKQAKEKAAREAMEAQGFVSKSAAEEATDSATSGTSDSTTDPVTLVQITDASETYSGPAIGEEPGFD